MHKITLISVFAIVLATFFFLSGCTPSTYSESSSVIDAPVIAVSNNWTYINLGRLSDGPGDNIQEIGNAILKWEQANANRKIVSMQIIYRPNSYAYGAEVVGISIYSEVVK